jgi:hypothetical protein
VSVFPQYKASAQEWALSQSRPSATDGTRHVREVENDQAVIIAGSTSQTDTLTTATRGNIGVVDTNIDRTVALNRYQPRILSSDPVNIGNVTVGWIARLETGQKKSI